MNFQSYIHGKNHWLLEPDLKSILVHYWSDFSKHERSLNELGKLVGERAYEMADWIDRSAVPELVMHDLDGNRVDRARLDPAHKELLKELAFINNPPYTGSSWKHHFSLGYLLADPGLYCTLIVTNQTAYPIYKYAPEQKAWLNKLLTGEAWGATWMSETQGGSDLGANNTVAVQKDGTWHLFGEDKYFASNAGIADIAVVTARPEGAPSGPKGLALYLVPRLDEKGALNYRVRRFKRKSATRAVPTGEVEFDGSTGYLVGQANQGIYYTMETLTVSRLANAVGAMGLARKAHLEALYRSRARSAFGSPLNGHPLVRYDLTDLAVRTAGGLALAFHAIHAFDLAWKDKPPYSSAYHYARFLSHLAKNRTADHATWCTQLAMELFGGVGFMEDFAISRLHREALVTSIWEGSSNIQALELLEVIQKKSAHESLLDEFIPLLEKAGTSTAKMAVTSMQENLDQLDSYSHSQAQWYSKDLLRRLADAAQVGLLYSIAENSGERYARMAELYASHFLEGKPYPSKACDDSSIWWCLMD